MMYFTGIIKKNCLVLTILFLIFLMYSLEKDDLEELIVQEINYGLDFKMTYNTGKTLKRRLTKNEKESSSFESNCASPVQLQNIADLSSIEFGVFMMETSGFHPLILEIKFQSIDKGRGRLDSRQACAVESAAKRSGLPVHVIIFSSTLHLRDNTTCELYKSKYPINFYTIDVKTFTINTPLGLNFSNF